LSDDLKQSIKDKARQLGFTLAGVTTPEPPPHLTAFESWLNSGMHGTMKYLSDGKSRLRRADPKLILSECKSILVLATPYPSAAGQSLRRGIAARGEGEIIGRVASYALGEDYHEVIPARLQAIVSFIEGRLGRSLPNRTYTDTGPILERDLAQRAGLGWIGRNTCLINPNAGSYFLLAEILLGIELEPDPSFAADHCGTCTRCLDACPTECILPERTIDARRCISYLTIELKDEIPPDLRPQMQDWVFGCDVCQMVCPWNRFAEEAGDPAFQQAIPPPFLTLDLGLSPGEFNQRFKRSPVKRARRRGYRRNVAVALGNLADERALPALERSLDDPELMVREHVAWAIDRIKSR
jgi:epoxyqueuosine reductase